MSLNITIPENINDTEPKISVIGIGGAGGNAVNTMINANVENIEFIVANTDGQALSRSLTKRQIQLGKNLTLGLGAGSDSEIGRKSAEESIEEILSELADVNMLFITTGMGGGTGSGAAPVIAKAAKDRGILTVAVVTKPFDFEGKKRMDVAESGLSLLKQCVDTLIVIPNQNLFKIANEKTTFAEAFKMADDVLYQGVCGITDLITNPGMINLDFADIKSIMGDMGKAMMGTGESSGEERAINAAQLALNNPLLDDNNIKGARSILLNIKGGPDMALFEVDEAASKIRNEVDGNANIIFGSSVDEALEGIIKISIVATGMSDTFQERNNEIDEHRDNSKTTHLNDVSFINTADEINIEGNKLHSQIETETEKTDQIDIENEINAIKIKNQYEPSQLNSDDILNNTEDNNLKNKEENLNLILETISDKNIPQDKPKNLLKRLSTFFVDDKINKTQIHPKINLKKEILENNETQIDEDKIEQTIPKDSDLFSIEKQSKITDHQIDLIDMDQQNQEIDEDVLEIPAFLRRQAN